jgi:2,4-dienoyl-CoA reductase-like NADH-dependent reductase (Old Yellow Enzyme family)
MVDDARLPDLFTPLTIGSLRLRNRFAMAPMTRGASPGGIPGPDVAAYYARRAAGGTALIITEGVRIPHPAAGWPDARLARGHRRGACRGGCNRRPAVAPGRRAR